MVLASAHPGRTGRGELLGVRIFHVGAVQLAAPGVSDEESWSEEDDHDGQEDQGNEGRAENGSSADQDGHQAGNHHGEHHRVGICPTLILRRRAPTLRAWRRRSRAENLFH